ncbi:MAG: glycosyltransferase family 2 protein [Bacteroidales bacterium]|nr:glycosyltransferase family 2 protein [Bacteroidales bacterium]
MNFAESYYKRYSVAPKIFNGNPRSDTGIIVVIPCYDDEFIFTTLRSLDSANCPPCSVEVIVVVNSAEYTDVAVVEKNRRIYASLCEKKDSYLNFALQPYIIEGVQHKIAGVGNARKVGMDEAVWRFATIENPRGVIVSLDADCLVSEDYFTEIYSRFYCAKDHPNACTLQFRHNFDEKLYSGQEIDACRRYEMYLRYFRLAQKVAGIPQCLHTIGSCLAVTAETYARMGGMARRQAGEDFYFLQKLALQSKVASVDKPIVFPSPSVSERVPFGTGRSVKKIIETGSCKVYNFGLFLLLKEFYSAFPSLYDGDSTIPREIIEFVGEQKFKSLVDECRKNTSDCKSFVKRMFAKFDVFFMIRFLNSFSESKIYPPEEIEAAVAKLLEYYGDKDVENLYSKVLSIDCATAN